MKLLTLAGTIALGSMILSGGAVSAGTARTALAVHQEPRGIGQLVATGDRVELVYTVDTRVSSPTGSVYVRNDLMRRFVRVPLARKRAPGSATLQAVVPGRLVRGHQLLYYAVVRDPSSGRSATVPAAGGRAPRTALVLGRPVIVRLGRHRFGHPRQPEQVVARAGPDQVGFENNEEYHFGPQTFLLGRDRSVWLHDGVNNRLLVWRPGAPDAVARTVPLPFFAGDSDVALGPGGTLYLTRPVGTGLASRDFLYRLTTTGEVLWRSELAGSFFVSGTFGLGADTSLRLGPDGALYCLVFMGGLPGGEWGWMPVATPAGDPLSIAAQRRGTRWPYQPVAGSLRLLSEVYTPPDAETAPHEARFALVDRRGEVVRAWRVLSRTDVNLDGFTPQLVGGDPVVVLDATARGNAEWEYVVLRLGRHATRFSLPRLRWGDGLLADLRVGPDGGLYQLGSSPATGVVINRYSLGAGR